MTGGDIQLLEPGHMLWNYVFLIPVGNQAKGLQKCQPLEISNLEIFFGPAPPRPNSPMCPPPPPSNFAGMYLSGTWYHPYLTAFDGRLNLPTSTFLKTNDKTKKLGNVKFYGGRSPYLWWAPDRGDCWKFEFKKMTETTCTFLRGYHYGGL